MDADHARTGPGSPVDDHPEWALRSSAWRVRDPGATDRATIALINWGFDLLDGVARTSLARCTPGVIRSRHRPEATRAALHQR